MLKAKPPQHKLLRGYIQHNFQSLLFSIPHEAKKAASNGQPRCFVFVCVFVEVENAALALHRVQTAVAGCNTTPLRVCVRACVCAYSESTITVTVMTQARQAPLMVPDSEASHCCPVLLTQSLSFQHWKTHEWKHGVCD